MKRNQGLSLIELIVVIAIMAVVVSVVGISITVVSRQRVSNAASDVRGQFQTAQTIAMSKDGCYVRIQKNTSNEVVFTIYSSSNVVLDKVTVNKSIKVQVHYSSDGENDWSDVGTTGLKVFYVRESGAFEDAVYCDGTTVANRGDVVRNDYINRIRFSNGSKAIELKLTKLTGKVSY